MVAFGAALHFDFELASDPRPFGVIVEELFGTASPEGTFREFFIDVENRKAKPPAPLDLRRLLRRVASGGVSMVAAETAPKTQDAELMWVGASTTPIAKRPERFAHTKCKYDLDVTIGANPLRKLGIPRVLDAVIAFADAVSARAGVVHFAETALYAGHLAGRGTSDLLTPAQKRHLGDLGYWQPRWGDVIRGPAWGTFLGAAHVAQLGGIARIERDAGCARVVALGSGGAFLQASPIEAPLVEDHDDRGALARIAQFLEPVMGRRESV